MIIKYPYISVKSNKGHTKGGNTYVSIKKDWIKCTCAEIKWFGINISFFLNSQY